MKIYAIIVTYNAMRRSWIERCLKSLEESTVAVTPIVIDNGSTDETRSWVPAHFPQAVWLPQERNLGFGQANNVGLRYALEQQADFVLLLNQDATLGSDALEKMLPHAADHTLLSPLHLNGDGTGLDGSFRECLLNSQNLLPDHLLLHQQLQPLYDGPTLRSPSVIPAACWLLPIAVVKQIGGFNPLFFHYGEDGNYANRLYYHHVEVKICPTATMCHDRGEHGNMTLYHAKRVRRQLLQTATNINFSFFKCVFKWVRQLEDCYLLELPQGHYRPGTWLVAMGWLALHAPAIWKSRRKEKQQGAAWL